MQMDVCHPTTIEAPSTVYVDPKSIASHGSGSFLADTHRELMSRRFPSTASAGEYTVVPTVRNL
jgi:hypothetical protein